MSTLLITSTNVAVLPPFVIRLVPSLTTLVVSRGHEIPWS
jgi:hypothetical protein